MKTAGIECRAALVEFVLCLGLADWSNFTFSLKPVKAFKKLEGGVSARLKEQS